MADDEQRNLSQICEMLLYEGVEAYKKDGPQVPSAPGRQTEAENEVKTLCAPLTECNRVRENSKIEVSAIKICLFC